MQKNPLTRKVILQLKQVRNEKGYSHRDIQRMLEKNGDYLSISSISRVFADGSEDKNFKYDETVRPIANVLLDMETIEDDDPTDVKTYKLILRYKMDRIHELEKQVAKLEMQLDHEKLRYHEKLEIEREKADKIAEFRSERIIKLEEINADLLKAVNRKDEVLRKLMEKCDNCKFHQGGAI